MSTQANGCEEGISPSSFRRMEAVRSPTTFSISTLSFSRGAGGGGGVMKRSRSSMYVEGLMCSVYSVCVCVYTYFLQRRGMQKPA